MSFSAYYAKARSARALSRASRLVRAINAAEKDVESLSDESLRAEFQALASRSLKERTVRGFARVREAARRTLGMRLFDVQLIGGLTLLEGKLAEMRTGEGKTLTIVAPAALLALEGKGVHVVTANSYLARRDADAMRPVYEMLGLKVAFTDTDQSLEEKQAAYGADVTYGVGHEFGFDYLKDNMVRDVAHKVQRGLFAAIVDEVDSILIDEARVPLIISARGPDVASASRMVDRAVRGLEPSKDFIVNLKERLATLTDSGYAKVEQSLVEQGAVASPKALYEPANLWLVRRVHSAVQAYGLYRRDRDYVVENNEIILVDTGTGRKMPGRRLEDGLHEALEAREGLAVRSGTVTRATITYQNFFRLYERLAGLTGTALTEAEEFSEFYGLETVVIPTNRPIQRILHEDFVFQTKSEKFAAAARLAAERQAKGQPVLIGCATIRDAEVMSHLLSREGVAHETLTAKHLAREAAIIAQAGRAGAVTVATNMAGRGTDIVLGGEKPVREEGEGEEAYQARLAQWEADRNAVRAAGGLFVLGTERNGLRRVDNQLAGRCGRQGDVGEVQFFVSLEDDLLRAFGKSRQVAMVSRLAQAAGGALAGKPVQALITASQRQVENQGFDARRTLMKFDSVLSDQRQAVYGLRDTLLREGCSAYARACVEAAVRGWCARNLPADEPPEQWDAKALKARIEAELFLPSVPLVGWIHKDELEAPAIEERLVGLALERFDSLERNEEACRHAVFQALDDMWTEHLTALEELRQAANLKGATGLNPVYQYHKEAFELFRGFDAAVSHAVAVALLGDGTRGEPQPAPMRRELTAEDRVALELERRWVGRNEPCPCGSGKRFKHCHGSLA